EFYGFDRPMLLQYADWLWNAAHFNFGQSYYFKLPVADLISSRLGVTMRLGLTAIVFALLVAVPLGVLAAKRPNSLTDKLALF
ncbi:ABC transporter permease, partial [Salmonella enterica]|nr:ABC transporter permease [Salmonella enterica]